MNEHIKELLQRLIASSDDNTPDDERTPLNAEELEELKAGLVEARADVEVVASEQGDSTDTIAALEEIALAVRAVRVEESRRDDAQAEVTRQAEEKRAEIRELLGEAEAEDEGAAEEPAADGEGENAQPAEAAEPAPEPAPEPLPEALPIAASAPRRPWGSSVERVQAFRGERHQPRPQAEEPDSPVVITAAAGVPGWNAGARMDWNSVGEALHSVHWANAKGGGSDGIDIPVVSMETAAERAEAKVGGTGSDRLVFDVLAAAKSGGVNVRDPKSVQAITAAGGLCGPPEVIYDWPTIGNARTPIGDALPRLPATRGQVMYPTPYYWADVENTDNTGGHSVINAWTLANDVAATPPNSTPRKVCARVICPTWVTVNVDAVYSCVVFGNFAARFNPLVNDNFMREVPKVIARFAEAQRIAAIDAASASGAGLGSTGRAFTYDSILGTGHDLKAALSILSTAYRQRYRMEDGDRLTFLTSEWLLRAVQEDMMRLQPGDDEFEATFAEYASEIFDNANLDVVVSPDISPFTIGTAGAPSGSAAYVKFPSTSLGYLYPPGTFSLLDGGRLDLGVVRDSSLIAANDFEMFFEYWEKVIQTGFASWKVTLPVSPKGSTSIPVANATPTY